MGGRAKKETPTKIWDYRVRRAIGLIFTSSLFPPSFLTIVMDVRYNLPFFHT